MPSYTGQFIWYELMTTNHDAALKFYQETLGLVGTDAGQPDMRYTVMGTGPGGMENGVGGVMDIPKPMLDAGVTPAWMGHIAVDDVDATCRRLESLSGKVNRPPMDIPNGVGRFAVVSDPQGAGFLLFRPNGQGNGTPPQHTPGRVGWRELMTSDWKAAFAFYSELFGWKKSTAVDMGPVGTYQTFDAGDQGGGMMTDPQHGQPTWRYYFNVTAAGEAVERIKRAGGKPLGDVMPVPGNMFVCNCVDPQGAHFSVVAALVQPPTRPRIT